jgi:hypothetical protein
MAIPKLQAAGDADAEEEEGVNKGATIAFPVTLSSLLFLDGWKWDIRTIGGAMYVGGPPAVTKTFETPGFLVTGFILINNSIDGKNVTLTVSIGKSDSMVTYTTSPAALYGNNTTRSDTSMFEMSLVYFSDFMGVGENPGMYEIHVNFSPPLPYEAEMATVTLTPPGSSIYPSSITPPPIGYVATLASISITDPETFVKQLDASKAVEEGVRRALLPFARKLV